MANTMIVKATSCTFSGTKAGAKSFRITHSVELVRDASDGALYTKRPAVRTVQMKIEVDFEYMDTMTAFVPGTYGSLVVVGKEGKGGTAATYTAAQSTLESISYSSTGGGTAVFSCDSTDGTVVPIIVS